MQYIFASDPHGIGDPWINLVTLAEEKYPNAQLVFGGDYIDGHPYSLQIVKFIRQEVQQDHAIALIGNHEQRMYEFVTKGDPTWYFKGGEETARTWLRASLSKKKIRSSLQENPYYLFLINLPTMYVTKHLVFVHAGLTMVVSTFNHIRIYTLILMFAHTFGYVPIIFGKMTRQLLPII